MSARPSPTFQRRRPSPAVSMRLLAYLSALRGGLRALGLHLSRHPLCAGVAAAVLDGRGSALFAGVALFVWARRRGEQVPTRREWVGGALIGAALFVGGTGGLVWAEQRIPSGVAALLVATVPLSFVLLEAGRRRRRPHGVVLPASPSARRASRSDRAGNVLRRRALPSRRLSVLLLGAFGWAWGSLFSRGAPLPSSPLMARRRCS